METKTLNKLLVDFIVSIIEDSYDSRYLALYSELILYRAGVGSLNKNHIEELQLLVIDKGEGYFTCKVQLDILNDLFLIKHNMMSSKVNNKWKSEELFSPNTLLKTNDEAVRL